MLKQMQPIAVLIKSNSTGKATNFKCSQLLTYGQSLRTPREALSIIVCDNPYESKLWSSLKYILFISPSMLEIAKSVIAQTHNIRLAQDYLNGCIN